jgi:hypothetical protein
VSTAACRKISRQRRTALTLIRKVILRQAAILNYVNPF